MKASICTSFDSSIAFPEGIRLIAQAGFEAVSLGADPRHSGYDTEAGRAAIQRQVRDEQGLTIDSVHAPFPEGDRLFSLDESERLESLRQCRIAVDATAALAGRIVVIHLIQPYGIPHGQARNLMIEHGRRSVESLVAYTLDRGVKLALENGQKRDYDEVLATLLSDFTDDHVGFCYDSGHENVQGTCFRMLEEFGDRLLTVHLHDNKGSDTHTLPYEGTIAWDRFREIFHALDYSGNLLLEASTRHSQIKDPAAFLARARDCAQRLMER